LAREGDERGTHDLELLKIVRGQLEQLLKAQLADHERLKKAGRIVALVFHRNGKRIKDVRSAWTAARTSAGYPGQLVHDLRRSAIRNLERDGIPRSSAMAMVGHKTESVYRRYAIVDSAALREAAAKIDRARGQNAGTVTDKTANATTAQPTTA
jgi:hypothetical protein